MLHFGRANFARTRARASGDAHARRDAPALPGSPAFVECRPDGTIVHASPGFLELFGYALAEVTGRQHALFLPVTERESPDYRRQWEGLATGQDTAGTYSRINARGRRLWVDSRFEVVRNRRGQVRRIIEHTVDVTDTQRRQADLRGQLAAIDRSQAVISFELDGTIIDANRNFLNALGYRRDEIVGRHHRMFVAPEEHAGDAYRQFWAALRAGEYRSALFRRRHKNGSPVWIQASYNPILDLAGQPIKIVKYATDVTEQTRAVTHLQACLARLSDTVPAIAADAQSARDSSTEAADRARHGDDTVEQLIARIDTINGHARDMAQIVSTLDSLAFQTNILALNASVEAARAGADGRGFAVVAQEVRALSNRSAAAAHDIGGRIRGITSSLDECSDTMARTRHAMALVVEATGRVDARIHQIADAAETQAGGMADLGDTLSRLETRAG